MAHKSGIFQIFILHTQFMSQCHATSCRSVLNADVPSVAQPVRRTPFSLCDKVKKKIKELVAMDIIEPVEDPTPWVSLVVVVPKQNDEIRLCVDMQRANEAIIRERYPIPLNQSTVFSKFDLKWGYHQLELHPDSHSIMTFTTHCGLYQYKRLMFGISSAPEVYQHVIQQVLQDCEGVANISDDIIVHGRSTIYLSISIYLTKSITRG